MAITPEAKRLLALRKRIQSSWSSSDWTEVGILTGTSDIIDRHPRLLRSLSFDDEDYGGCVIDVLQKIAVRDPDNLSTIEDYVRGDTQGEAINVSSLTNDGPRFVIQPTAFQIPNAPIESDLLSAMMPFDQSFNGVYEVIKESASSNFMRAERADNIWQASTIIQDIFSLIFRSKIVVCDFSSKNTNVFYEAGIAHTLGKHVIPIAQHLSELPFDLQHHRAIIYQNNAEGRATLSRKLYERISYLLNL